MTEQDLHYLQSILGYLLEVRKFKDGRQDYSSLGLAGELLSDNIDWLDCFIIKHKR